MRQKDLPQYFDGKIKLMRPLTPEVTSWCWVWCRSLSHGYAQGWWGGAVVRMHLVVLELAGRPRPSEMESDHLCCRRACVNPDHIEFVTSRENAQRVALRGHSHQANRTHCKRGHEFTPENTVPNTGGRNRQCRICKLETEKLRKRKVRTGTTEAPVPPTHCKRGHPLSGDNMRYDGKGRRVCRACMRMHQATHRKRVVM